MASGLQRKRQSYKTRRETFEAVVDRLSACYAARTRRQKEINLEPDCAPVMTTRHEESRFTMIGGLGKVNRIHPPPRRGASGHRVPLSPLDGSTGTPYRTKQHRKLVWTRLCGRVKREQCTPPHATPPMGTGRRFTTAPAPATTPERASGASRTCRFDVCESRRGPLRVWKAASKAAPVRVELRRASNRCGPAEDGAQCH